MIVTVGKEQYEFKPDRDILATNGKVHKILSVSRTGMMLLLDDDSPSAGKCFWKWERIAQYFLIEKFNVRRNKSR